AAPRGRRDGGLRPSAGSRVGSAASRDARFPKDTPADLRPSLARQRGRRRPAVEALLRIERKRDRRDRCKQWRLPGRPRLRRAGRTKRPGIAVGVISSPFLSAFSDEACLPMLQGKLRVAETFVVFAECSMPAGVLGILKERTLQPAQGLSLLSVAHQDAARFTTRRRVSGIVGDLCRQRGKALQVGVNALEPGHDFLRLAMFALLLQTLIESVK